MKESEYSELTQLANEPTIDHIRLKSTQLGYVPVKEDDWERLQELANHPDLKHIEDKSKELGYIPVKEEEFNEMKQIVDKPTIDHIIKKSGELGYVPVQEHELEELRHPTKEHVEELATGYNLVAVPKDKYQELESTVNEPTIDFIKTKAESLGSVVVAKEEYENQVLTN